MLRLLILFISITGIVIFFSRNSNNEKSKVLGTNIIIEKTRGEFTNIHKINNQENTQELIDDKISAKSYLIYEEDTGQTLYEKNADQILPIASLTKILSTLVVYENVNPSDNVLIKSNDLLNIKPIINLKSGVKIKIYDLIDAVLICSANDAVNALSNVFMEKTGLNFVEAMNNKASVLQMTNSKFSNAFGFDYGDNYSTANDLKKLIQYTSAFSIYKNIGRKTIHTFSDSEENYKFNCKTTNKLIKDDNQQIENIKTGYTEIALGSMAVRYKTNGISYILIVIGSKNREFDILNLAKAL